jgi:hypothetical protein
MVVAYLLICLIPVALILAVFGAIGAAAMKVVKDGKRVYADMRPDIVDLKEKAARAQQKGLEFSERGKKLSETFEEMGGRWAFISQSLAENTKSPIVKLAGMAGKHTGQKEKD